ARAAAWESGANAAGAGRGFAAQVDVAALFVERSLDLLTPGGTMALLLPVKLWRALAGGGVRRLLANGAQIVRIEDPTRGTGGGTFDAAVYPSLIVARRRTSDGRERAPVVEASVHDSASRALSWRVATKDLPFDPSRGSPWILLPPDARHGFDLLREL